MAKVARGEIYIHPFIVFRQSLNAQKYDPKVCKRYWEDETKLAKNCVKRLNWNDNACIKMDGCIQDLLIAWRYWGRGL